MVIVGPPIPERLGRYEIIERLASGGMGEVFVARFAGPGGFIKPVAVKRIHPHLACDETFIHMLHDEAKVTASIKHPNIVTTIDVGSEGDNHFVVLDYVSGDPLSQLIRELKQKNQVMPSWVVAWIGAEIAGALHAVHEAKNLQGESLEIVHRDVSPANILLSDAGHPMLFDFGIAKAKERLVQTSAGELKGKIPYMAPEIFRGVSVDRTVDVFSLGVVLYELLTLTCPFQRPSDLEMITALQAANIPPPSHLQAGIDPRLDSLVMGAMAHDRENRHPTAATVEHDLRAWARGTKSPHDAASVAAWVGKTFPDRTEARTALLARVASGTRQTRSGTYPTPSLSSGTSADSSGGSTPGMAHYTPPGLRTTTLEARLQASQRNRVFAVGSAVFAVALGAGLAVVLGVGSRANVPEAHVDEGVAPASSAMPQPEPMPTNSAEQEPSASPSSSAAAEASADEAASVAEVASAAPFSSATTKTTKRRLSGHSGAQPASTSPTSTKGKGPILRSYDP